MDHTRQIPFFFLSFSFSCSLLASYFFSSLWVISGSSSLQWHAFMLGERTLEIYPTLFGMDDWIRRVHGFVDDLAFVFAIFKIGHDTGYIPQHSQDCFFSCLLSTCSVVDFGFFSASSNFLQLLACMYMVSSFCVARLAMHIPHYSLVWPPPINCMASKFLCFIQQGIMHCLFCCHLHISIYTHRPNLRIIPAVLVLYALAFPRTIDLSECKYWLPILFLSIGTGMTMMLDMEPHC